jgi:hypothetical protein
LLVINSRINTHVNNICRCGELIVNNQPIPEKQKNKQPILKMAKIIYIGIKVFSFLIYKTLDKKKDLDYTVKKRFSLYSKK